MISRFWTTAAAVASLGFAAGALAGCAQMSMSRDIAEATDGYGLHYVDTGPTAKLAYGPANSVAVGLMLECDKGSRRVELTDMARGDPRLTLRSGAARADFTGVIEDAPGTPIIAAITRTDNPALSAFRSSGKLDISNGGHRYSVNARGDEARSVESFFQACEA